VVGSSSYCASAPSGQAGRLVVDNVVGPRRPCPPGSRCRPHAAGVQLFEPVLIVGICCVDDVVTVPSEVVQICWFVVARCSMTSVPIVSGSSSVSSVVVRRRGRSRARYRSRRHRRGRRKTWFCWKLSSSASVSSSGSRAQRPSRYRSYPRVAVEQDVRRSPFESTMLMFAWYPGSQHRLRRRRGDGPVSAVPSKVTVMFATSPLLFGRRCSRHQGEFAPRRARSLRSRSVSEAVVSSTSNVNSKVSCRRQHQ